jgi:hypothetical protein
MAAPAPEQRGRYSGDFRKRPVLLSRLLSHRCRLRNPEISGITGNFYAGFAVSLGHAFKMKPETRLADDAVGLPARGRAPALNSSCVYQRRRLG